MTITRVLRKTAYWLPRTLDKGAQKLLSSGLGWAYGLASPGLRRAMASPFRLCQSAYSYLKEAGQGSSYLLTGSEANSGLPLTVALTGVWEFGQRNTFLNFQYLLFGEGVVNRTDCGAFPLWQVRRQAEALAPQADLVVVNAHPWRMWSPPQGDWACGPESLRMVFDYPPGAAWQQIEQRLKSHKRNLRHLLKLGYTYRISHDEDDFTTFFHHYYLPMVKNRYKDYGDINHEPGLRHLFQADGLLLWVEDEQGQTVSAGLKYFQHHVLYSLIAGVRDGDQALVKRGALAALYYYSLQHGFRTGCRRHDAGVCLPFLSDGVFEHKRLWGYSALKNDWRPRSWLIWAPRSAPPALAWLKAHPFLPGYARWGGPNAPGIYAAL